MFHAFLLCLNAHSCAKVQIGAKFKSGVSTITQKAREVCITQHNVETEGINLQHPEDPPEGPTKTTSIVEHCLGSTTGLLGRLPTTMHCLGHRALVDHTPTIAHCLGPTVGPCGRNTQCALHGQWILETTDKMLEHDAHH